MAPGAIDEEEEEAFDDDEDDDDDSDCSTNSERDASKHGGDRDWELESFDMDGIMNRIAVFPVDIGLYGQIYGLDGDTVLYIKYVNMHHMMFSSRKTFEKLWRNKCIVVLGLC